MLVVKEICRNFARVRKMKKRYIYIFSVVILLIMVLCNDEKNDVLFVKEGYAFPYNLAAPGKSWELPGKLVEISGISYVDENRIACVQDEKGNIYIFNTEKGEIEKKIDFGEDGDYEDIAVVGDDAWVLKSSGTLYRNINYLNENELKVVKFKNSLSKKNDAEGLAYDPDTHSLLISCKGHPFIEDNDKQKNKKFKAVYRFDLETKHFDKSPFLLIPLDSLRVKISESNRKSKFTFKPSGIEIHPITGNLYIIASAGKMLVVLSKNRKILAMIRLKKEIYKQPEGICFTPNGTMYISNEGGKGKGTLLRFSMMHFNK